MDDDLGPWEDAKYGQFVDLIWPWMSGIPRWLAIFILPPDCIFDRVRPLLALPEGTTYTRGTYGFSPQSDSDGDHIMHDSAIVREMQAIGDLIMVFYCQSGANPASNFPTHVLSTIPLVFTKPTSHWLAPPIDPHGREPKTVARMIEAYLPVRWTLVLSGLSGIILTMCSIGHFGRRPGDRDGLASVGKGASRASHSPHASATTNFSVRWCSCST